MRNEVMERASIQAQVVGHSRERAKSGFLGGVAGLWKSATKKTVANRIGIKARD